MRTGDHSLLRGLDNEVFRTAEEQTLDDPQIPPT